MTAAARAVAATTDARAGDGESRGPDGKRSGNGTNGEEGGSYQPQEERWAQPELDGRTDGDQEKKDAEGAPSARNPVGGGANGDSENGRHAGPEEAGRATATATDDDEDAAALADHRRQGRGIPLNFACPPKMPQAAFAEALQRRKEALHAAVKGMAAAAEREKEKDAAAIEKKRKMEKKAKRERAEGETPMADAGDGTEDGPDTGGEDEDGCDDSLDEGALQEYERRYREELDRLMSELRQKRNNWRRSRRREEASRKEKLSGRKQALSARKAKLMKQLADARERKKKCVMRMKQVCSEEAKNKSILHEQRVRQEELQQRLAAHREMQQKQHR